jgi:transcriptional regulator with XRE-family HTH domain
MSEHKPIPKLLRKENRAAYDKQPILNRIKELLKERNESYREASLRSGLDNAAIQRIVSGQRPSLTTLIYLADHFDVNPNEFLELAYWPKLKIFDVSSKLPEKLPSEAVDVAMRITQIKNPGTRKRVAEAIMILLEKYFE